MSSRGRILVVDDSRSTRALIAASLIERGYEVVELDSGEAALARVHADRFDLVLLDVIMKGIDGLGVLTSIRQRKTKLELPVLMATGRADSADVVRALELGANDYVTKPFDLPVVLARIESQLALCRQAEGLRPGQVTLDRDGTVSVGTVLDGRYELLEVIGVGGFAVVYRGRQVSTGQRVAVKVMTPHRAAQGDVELARFQRETSLIAELSHPHIVRLIDSGWITVATSSLPRSLATEDSTATAIEGVEGGWRQPGPRRIPFLVMELIHGETLKARLRREGQMTTTDAVDLLLPVVSALWEAHSKGAIHRDLKPGNIMLTKDHDGSTKPIVLDFGVAKLVREPSNDLTEDGIVGTPGWWAPEQARGSTALDERADEYQLGAILYACITGRKPFEGRGMALVHEVATGRIDPPSKHVPSLPFGFESVLLKMMASEPSERYPSMRAVARSLLPFASRRAHGAWAPVFEEGRTIPPRH